MLGRRLASAAVLITSMILLLWADFYLGEVQWFARSGVLLAALCIVISTAAADEFHRLWKGIQCHPSWVMMLGAAVMVAMANLPVLWQDYPADCPIGKLGWVLSGIGAATLIAFVYEMLNFDPQSISDSDRGDVAVRIGRSTLAFVYIAMLFGFVLSHRQIQGDNMLGIAAIVLIITTVKLSDSFAYFVGKSLGKNKIAPKLSPNKTVEGAIAAVIGGIVGAAIVVFIVCPYLLKIENFPKPWWWVLVYGIGVTLAGMLGDLAESLLKRDAQIKDSSSWLPGLGGVLDVIDSLVFAAPVSYVIWLIGKP